MKDLSISFVARVGSPWLVGVFLAASFALAGCSAESPTDCGDGADNDGDGLIDTIDPGCAFGSNFEAPDPSPCQNGLDDDGDGLPDNQDPGCVAGGPDESDPVRQCNDGLDNDEDGMTDLADSGCDDGLDDLEKAPPACVDGKDNDGDGKTDWPHDTGCNSAVDSDETDGPAVACGDGADNDGDGKTDYPNDPGCTSGTDMSEENPTYGACGVGVPMLDITDSGTAADSFGSAVPSKLISTCGGLGGEMAYTYLVKDAGRSLVVSTDDTATSVDTVVYVLSDCADVSTELACNDDDGTVYARASKLVIGAAPPGLYTIIVDRKGPSSLGDFVLHVEERLGQGAGCDPAGVAVCPDGHVCRALLGAQATTCQLPVCSDSLDDDADGKTDFPADPGCDSPADDTETNAAQAPACADGLDNDGDGKTDWPQDDGCLAASSGTEIGECTPGVGLAPLDLHAGATGTTVGGTTAMAGTCGGADDRPERIFVFRADRPYVSLTLSLKNPETTFDTVLYARSGTCGDTSTQLACNDDSSGPQSEITIVPAQGVDTFVFVDTYSFGGVGGPFRLSATGVIAVGGACTAGDAAFVCESGTSCGQGVCQPGACNDGVDNDGDGKSDVADPGCVSAEDTDETNPATLPACADGVDNDGDSKTDYPTDPGCERASDGEEVDCVDPDLVDVSHSTGNYAGNSTGKVNNFSLACGSSSNTAPDVVHSFTVPGTVQVTIDTCGASFDTSVALINACVVGPTELACNDDGCAPASTLPVQTLAAGTHYIVVDGYSSGSGAYNLKITGTIAAGVACDPAQVVPGFLSCATGTSCVAVGGPVDSTFRCQ